MKANVKPQFYQLKSIYYTENVKKNHENSSHKNCYTVFWNCDRVKLIFCNTLVRMLRYGKFTIVY